MKDNLETRWDGQSYSINVGLKQSLHVCSFLLSGSSDNLDIGPVTLQNAAVVNVTRLLTIGVTQCFGDGYRYQRQM